MDFETSCWGTNGGQTLFNYDNPVQRRSKIDYFDSASITPIVSHISSNGYYGYCPINVPSRIDMDVSNGAKIASDIDFGAADMQSMDSSNSEQINHHQHHQGRPMFENRKRHAIAVELVENDAKRRRSHLPVEGLYIPTRSLCMRKLKLLFFHCTNTANKCYLYNLLVDSVLNVSIHMF